jgi:hypothetical protein
MGERLPPGAWQFATDPAHYDFSSPRCVKELRPGQIDIGRRDGGKLARIKFLPSPFKHDAPLSISYVDLYSLEVAFTHADHWGAATGQHESKHEDLGDVQLDEILPDKQGCSHEIALIGRRIRHRLP